MSGQQEAKSLETAGFVIERSKSLEYQRLQWVLRAMSQDETRYFLCGVHIDDRGNMVATDGRRMHIWRNCPIKQTGFFRAVATSKAVFLTPADGQFPNWERTYPENLPEVIDGISFSSIKRHDLSPSIFKLFRKTGACFNLNFILDLNPMGLSWTVYGGDPDHAWLFRNGDLEAVIMPMHVEAAL